MIHLLLYTCVAIGIVGGVAVFMSLRKKIHRGPSFLRLSIQIAGALGVAFLAAELCARLAMAVLSAGEARPTSFDAELGWSRPPMNRVASVEGAGRAASIVFAGDSVAFGQGVTPEEGMVHQVRLQLAAHGRSVLNAAVSGYGIGQTSLYVKRHLPAWEKVETLVLVLFAGNDLADTATNMRYGREKPLFRHRGEGLQLDAAGVSRFSRRNLFTESRLIYGFTALYPSFSRLVDRLSGQVVLGEAETRLVVSALLADLLETAREEGVETLLVLVPEKRDLEAPGPAYVALEGLLQENGARVLSLGPLLQETGDGADSLYLPGDPWHFSAAGHRRVADLLADAILRPPPAPLSGAAQ